MNTSYQKESHRTVTWKTKAAAEKLWCGLPDYATAYADGRLAFTFKNGSTLEG